MDSLADLFARTRIGGAILCRSELRAPWGMAFPASSRIGFHIVVEGACWLHVERQPTRMLPGDFALLSRGSAHVLSHEPGAAHQPFTSWLGDAPPSDETIISGGGRGERSVVLCGAYDCEAGAALLFRQLPPLLIVRRTEGDLDEDLGALQRLLLREAERREPGRSAMLSRLTESLLLVGVRRWLRGPGERARGWLPALRDPQIGRAITIIHGRYREPWTVGSLAREVGMSSSNFARRFRALVGRSPGDYVQGWRIEAGAELLRNTEQTVAEVAHAVGYDSEFAFNRAFRRAKGTPPGRYRHRS